MTKDYFKHTETMECLQCKHESKTWLEIQGKEFVNDNDELENHVFCPKCESWDYYLK